MNNYKFKTKPYKHQLTALKRALKHGHLAVLWEPRLGKTKLIVDWACAEYQRGNVKRVLIVCPLSVSGVWEEEFETHAPIPYHLYLLDTHDLAVPVEKGRLNVLVVNYDRAWRREKIVKKFKPDMVVCDESHRIKRWTAKRARYMHRWNKAKYRAILTGTVTPKGYIDIFSQWKFLNPKRFGNRIGPFREEYVRMGGYMGKQVKGYRHIIELKEKIKADATIRREDEVFDMPPTLNQRVPVFLSDKARMAYMKMEYELFLELRHGEVSDAKNVAVKLMRLQQITGGWIKSDEGNVHQISNDKILACGERLENLWDDDEPVVVFARFRAEVSAIARLGVRAGVDTYMLTGSTRSEDRTRRRRKFQARPGPSLFISQIQAGSLGIPLHTSHEVLFYSVSYSYDDYFQATRRIHHPTQTRTMRYQHLMVPNSVDEDVFGNLMAKEDTMAVIMGNPKKYARVLERRIENRH